MTIKRTLLGIFVAMQGPAFMANFNQGFTFGLSRPAAGLVAFLILFIGVGICRGWVLTNDSGEAAV